MTEPAAPRTSKTRISIGMLGLAMVGLVLPTIVIGFAYRSCIGTTMRGSVSVRGASGEWRSALATCTADPTSLAVALGVTDGPIVVRAVLDPLDGARLELVPPAASPIVVTAATCPGLRVDLRRAGARADGTQLLDGAVSASCTTPAGRIDVDAWWRGCHQAE